MIRTVLLGGPTASGKSEVALHLAALMNGEIICADSMQVYRCLDIATAKPTPDERARVPHHGLDLVGPGESFSVAAWRESALAAEQSIHARGRTAIVTGGTGLYLRAFRFGLDPLPPTSPEEQTAFAAASLESLVAELLTLAPDAASRIDLQNRRRVERALVMARHGILPASRDAWHSTSSVPCFALRRDPADLARRIRQRVDRMFESGLLAEYHEARAAGLGPDTTAWQALGYKEVARWAEGYLDETACRELLTARTRQFARRQMTWLRREPDVQWCDLEPGTAPEEIARSIARRLDTGPAA